MDAWLQAVPGQEAGPEGFAARQGRARMHACMQRCGEGRTGCPTRSSPCCTTPACTTSAPPPPFCVSRTATSATELDASSSPAGDTPRNEFMQNLS